MHPLLASASRLALYLLGWSMVGGLVSIAYASTGNFGGLEALVLIGPPWLVYAFVCLSAWYVCRATPLVAGNVSRVLAAHVGSGVLASGIWIASWEVWSRVLADDPAYGPEIRQVLRDQTPFLLAAGVLLFWLSGMLHYLLIAFERSRQAETRQLGLEVMAREAELKALRAQIDPHFLFNSLHSVGALTLDDPAGARRMCLLLGEFFRTSVRLGGRDEIRLEEEIQMARQYLEIEKVRFGPRLASEVASPPECGNCMIPPLILQPLVENAVRHGIQSLVDGGIVRITAGCANGNLRLSVENPFDADRPSGAGTGVGLANVRRRLEARFGVEAAARVEESQGRFRIEIRVPCSRVSERAADE